MRGQDGGGDAKDDGEGELGGDIALLTRIQQGAPGIVRIEMDIDAGATGYFAIILPASTRVISGGPPIRIRSLSKSSPPAR